MGTIREEIELTGSFKSKRVLALFDSGARRNYIKRILGDGESVEDIGFHIFERKVRAILANGAETTGEMVRFRQLGIKGCKINEPGFVIMDNLIEDVIIGVDFMQETGITLDPPNEKIGHTW